MVLVARGRVDLDEAVREIKEAGGEVHGLLADIGDPSAPQRVVHEAAALVGPIDLLLNNASTLGPTPLRLLFDLDRSDFERTLAVNLLGPLQLARVAGGSMAVRGGGTIVNISSDAAVEPYPRWGAYGASKAALDQLSAILAAELRDARVRVLAIDPGEMDTDMHRDAIPDADPSDLADPRGVAERILEILASPLESGARVAAQSWRSA